MIWLSLPVDLKDDEVVARGPVKTSEVLECGQITLIPAFSLKGRRGAFPLHFRERVRVRVKAASRIHAA